jgi:hypothetical protein
VSGPGGAPAGDGGPRRVDRLSLVIGVLFVLAGIVFLLDALDVWRLQGDYLVPLGLIVLGLAVLASGVPLGTRHS